MRRFSLRKTVIQGAALAGAVTVIGAAYQAPYTAQAAHGALADQDAFATTTGTLTPYGSNGAGTPFASTSTPQPTATSMPIATPHPLTNYGKLLPRPTVHRTNGYEVGAYYFSGWSHGQNDNLTPLLTRNYPLNEPLISWYDDSQEQVDKNIQQAAANGIDFFAFDYYNLSHTRYATDQSLNEGLGFFLSSKQRYRMNFAVTFIDQAPFLPTAAEWPRLVNTWISYMLQPDYVRVAGKPLFIIFSPEHMRDIFHGTKALHGALDYLRIRAKAAHLPGVTIASGATLAPRYNPFRILQLKSEGYDVLTGYNYHSIGNEKYRKPAPYSALVSENEQMWDRVGHSFSEPYIPVVTSGWDQRLSAREQKTAIIYAGRSANAFECYVGAARHWVDTNRTHTVAEKIVMIFAWNESGEGGAIIPTKGDHGTYSKALHTAFTAHAAPICATKSSVRYNAAGSAAHSHGATGSTAHSHGPAVRR